MSSPPFPPAIAQGQNAPGQLHAVQQQRPPALDTAALNVHLTENLGLSRSLYARF